MKLPKWGPICWMILSRRVHVQKPARYTPKALSTSSWPIWSLFICLIYCLTFIFFSRSSLALSSSSVPLHAPEFSYQYLSPKTNYVMFMFVPSFRDGRYRKKKKNRPFFKNHSNDIPRYSCSDSIKKNKQHIWLLIFSHLSWNGIVDFQWLLDLILHRSLLTCDECACVRMHSPCRCLVCHLVVARHKNVNVFAH